MHQGLPGNPLNSFIQRRRKHGSIRPILDSLNTRMGDIFWYFTSLQPSSAVLVIYDLEAATGILKDESWIFSKALEPWKNHHHSEDPFERLVGEGAFLADGIQHHNAIKLIKKRLSSDLNWQRLNEWLLVRAGQFDHDTTKLSLTGFAADLLQKMIDIYYDLRLDSDQISELQYYLQASWQSNQKYAACPFRLRKIRAVKQVRQGIDRIRHSIQSELNKQNSSNNEKGNQSIIRKTSLSELDEIMTFSLSVMHKIYPLLSHVVDNLTTLPGDTLEKISKERNSRLEINSADQLSTQCQETFDRLVLLRSELPPPISLIKRINVCDALIHGVNIPETTEIWIPAWIAGNQYLFGDGCYKCPADNLSLLILARLAQLIATNRIKQAE